MNLNFQTAKTTRIFKIFLEKFKLVILIVALSQVRSESWVAWSGSRPGLPSDAVYGGNELEGAYVIRANTHGVLLPGKYNPGQGVAYVSNNGAEHAVSNFEVKLRTEQKEFKVFF